MRGKYTGPFTVINAPVGVVPLIGPLGVLNVTVLPAVTAPGAFNATCNAGNALMGKTGLDAGQESRKT